MKNLIIFFCIFLALYACSPTVHVQKDNSIDLTKYTTYAWVDTKASDSDTRQRPKAFADISVRNAANEQLANAGYKEVKENADMLISYDVMIERNKVLQSDPVYSNSFSRVYYNPRSGRWRSIYFPSQFLGYDNYEVPIKEGTITISIVDANTDKLVWQGWTTKELNYSRLTDEEISGSVKSIFNKLK